MTEDAFAQIFTAETLRKLLPPDRSDQFFDAMYGDAKEGAYDISLEYVGHDPVAKQIRFELHLTQRPGKCLACNLTYGLPEVFARHPLLNLKGMVKEILTLAGKDEGQWSWKLGHTRPDSAEMHIVPLEITLG